MIGQGNESQVTGKEKEQPPVGDGMRRGPIQTHRRPNSHRRGGPDGTGTGTGGGRVGVYRLNDSKAEERFTPQNRIKTNKQTQKNTE